MFTPNDKPEKIRLRVVLNEGQCTLADGSSLPRLKPGALAKLRIGVEDLVDESERTKLRGERRILFLPSGSKLWARIRTEFVTKEFGGPSGPQVFPEIGERFRG